MSFASDWAKVDADIAAIVGARPSEYDPVVRANLADLIALLKATDRHAPLVEPGYWPTFNLSWDVEGAENLTVEVFGDHYEIYRFFDGKTDIWHDDHRPGEALSQALLDELPPAAENAR